MKQRIQTQMTRLRHEDIRLKEKMLDFGVHNTLCIRQEALWYFKGVLSGNAVYEDVMK